MSTRSFFQILRRFVPAAQRRFFDPGYHELVEQYAHTERLDGVRLRLHAFIFVLPCYVLWLRDAGQTLWFLRRFTPSRERRSMLRAAATFEDSRRAE